MMYYLRLFMRTLYISLIVGLIVTISYYFYDSKNGKDIYSASTGILVNEDVNSPYIPYEGGEVVSVITDTDFSEYLLNVAIHYINTPEYQKIVKNKLAGTIPDIENYNFDDNVSTSTYAGSNVVTITAKYENSADYPVLIANALADAYKEENAKKLGADYFIIISRAAKNETPINMSLTMSCIVYGVGSLLLTFILILMIDSLARSEGTYLSWKLFRKKKKHQHRTEEIYEEVG